MNDSEKIRCINQIVKDYFNNPNHPRKVVAKELMGLFLDSGIFSSNHRDGLPLRKLFRKLDDNNMLSMIPHLVAERKDTNINWYFQDNASARFISKIESSKIQTSQTAAAHGRANSDEYYVIGLCDEVLGQKAVHQYTFDFLRGDSGRKLNVDAYYKDLNLVIEYCERQHTEAVAFFDHNERLTVSGVTRGEQRKIYDQRRRELLPQHGIKLIEIHYTDFGSSKKLKRNPEHDKEVIKQILKKHNII